MTSTQLILRTAVNAETNLDFTEGVCIPKSESNWDIPLSMQTLSEMILNIDYLK